MPRRLVLLAALAAAGCGGSGDDGPSAQTVTQEPPAQTAPASSTEAAPATEREPARERTPKSVAPEKRGLERKGFEVEDSGTAGIGGAQGALELPLEGGGSLTVIAFETRRAAERHAAEYRPLAEKYPEYFRLEIRGTTLYLGVAEQPEKLIRTGFADAVEAATSSR